MNILKQRWLYLITAVMILLFMGIAYAFSLFVVPIESDLGFTRTETSFAFTLCFIFFSLGSLITGFLIHKYKLAVLLRIGALMIGFGFYASTLAIEPWQLYFTYSFCCGFSIGLAYNISVSIIPLYFHDKLGLATGILLMGFAMSTSIFGPICEVGLSSFGWKGVFSVLALSTFIVLLLGSYLLHKPNEEQTLCLPKGNDKKSDSVNSSPREMLKSKVYYIFVLIYILVGGIGISLINHAAPTLQEDLHVTANNAALIVSFVCLFNGLGRVLWGLVFDRIKTTHVLKGLGTLAVVSMVIILLALSIKSAIWFGVGCALALFCYGGSSSLAPIIVRSLFGDQYFSMNFALTNIGTMLLSCVPTLVGFLQSVANNYTLPYIMLLLFAVFALMFAFLYQPMLNKSNRK